MLLPLHRLTTCLACCALALNAAAAHARAEDSTPADTAASSAQQPAQPLDAQLDCSSTGHGFIAPLMASGAIRTEPMHVEPNSVNAFHPLRPLSAYGFSVLVTLGYQQGDPIFTQGTGQPIGLWAYGVVVHGAPRAVAARARAAGSHATVVQALPLVPLLTAIVCNSP
jgi:hypothetical protein